MITRIPPHLCFFIPPFASKVPNRDGCGLTCPPWLAPWLGLFPLEADWSEGAVCTWLPWWNRFPTDHEGIKKTKTRKHAIKRLGRNHIISIISLKCISSLIFFHLLSSCHFQTLLADPEAPTMLSTMLSRFRISIHSPYGRCRHLIVDFGHGWDIPNQNQKGQVTNSQKG